MYYKNKIREYLFRILVGLIIGFTCYIFMAETYNDFVICSISNYKIYVSHVISIICFFLIFNSLRESE